MHSSAKTDFNFHSNAPRMLGRRCWDCVDVLLEQFPPSASFDVTLDCISFVLAFPKHDHSCQTHEIVSCQTVSCQIGPGTAAADWLSVRAARLARTHKRLARVLSTKIQADSIDSAAKTKFTRQRRLTALARSVQKAARTPSDSQADSVDDYTKAKLKQGCSVRKAAKLAR